MIAQRISILDNFNFEIQHRKCSSHTNADAYPAYLFGNANGKYVECYPNSDPYFQGQTEENVECRVCDQTHPGNCPAVMAEENELL